MALQDRNDGRTNYLMPGLVAGLVIVGLVWMFGGSMWGPVNSPSTTIERTTTPPATTTLPTTTPPARTTP